MKKVLVLLLVFVSCSKRNEPVPVYTDISGHWVGQSKNLSVDFYIDKSDKFYVRRSGLFELRGNWYGSDYVSPVDTAIFLYSNQGNDWLLLKQFSVSGDYLKLISVSQEFFVNADPAHTIIHDTLRMTRK